MVHGAAPVRYYFAILCLVLLAPSMVHADEQRIAIVASSGSVITTISAKQVRRAFLGASIVLNGVEARPLLNKSDKLAEEVFLQRIMFMSYDAYERQLISRTFQGGTSPKTYESLSALLTALRSDNAAITFMLYEVAEKTPGIRIIGTL